MTTVCHDIQRHRFEPSQPGPQKRLMALVLHQCADGFRPPVLTARQTEFFSGHNYTGGGWHQLLRVGSEKSIIACARLMVTATPPCHGRPARLLKMPSHGCVENTDTWL
jgi:hypothetical protein